MAETPTTNGPEPLPPPALELEHAIGYNARYGNCVGAGEKYYSAMGGSVVVGDLKDVHCQEFLRGLEEEVGVFCASKDGGRLVVGQLEGQKSDIVVWDLATRSILHRLTDHENGVAALSISPDDKLLLSVGSCTDRRVIVWDLELGQPVAMTTLPPTDDQAVVSCCAIGGLVEDIKRRKTQNYQFTILSGSKIYRYTLDPQTSSVAPLRTTIGNIVRQWTSVAYSQQGDLLFLGSETGDVTVISTTEGAHVKNLRVLSSGIRYIIVTGGSGNEGDDGKGFQYARYGQHAIRSTTLKMGGGNGEVVDCRVRDHADVTFEVTSRAAVGGPVNSLSVAGDSVVAGTTNGEVYKINGSEVVKIQTAPLGAVVHVAHCPHANDKFVTCSEDGFVRFWELNGYQQTASGGNYKTRTTPSCAAYVGATDTVVTGWSDGGVRCIDTLSGETHWAVMNAHQEAVTDIAIPETLQFFVTSSETGDVKVWNTRTRVLSRELKGHKSRVSQIQLFDNATHLLSASKDRSIIMWDMNTGQRVASNLLQMGHVNSIYLLRNQNNFLSTGSDKKVSLWDVRQQEPVAQVPLTNAAHDTAMTTMHGTSDDRFFATGGTDHCVTLWDFPSLRPIQTGIGHTNTVTHTRFSPDNRQIISCGMDRSILIWNFYT
eukprot:TRINITY_DN3324_c0_g1_i2.p1 TRINITY_DN3324_c0_g1~~TRINITY_DN3324_c0_g1_i2.p1  ORF type:complete len:655 (+),score=149.61 TRINITY_DN3324_c0_g1_i2:47-2011(+)